MTGTAVNGHKPTARRSGESLVPPRDLEAEQLLLGSVLLGDDATFDAAAAMVREADFYIDRHAGLWGALMALRQAGEPIDPVVVRQRLDSATFPDSDAAANFLVDLMEKLPHGGRAAGYARIVAGASGRRQAIGIAGDLAAEARDTASDLAETIGRAEGRLHAILERGAAGRATSAAELMHAAIAALGSERRPGLTSGYFDLDQLTGGLGPGQLWILAARPSIGKTALAGNIALSAAESGAGVLFVSLEQSGRELSDRFLCSLARIDADTLRGRLTDAQRDSVVTAANHIARLPLLVDDSTPQTMSQIAALARVHRRRDKIGLVIVDYLQLINPEDRKTPREQQVAEIARALKMMARGLEIPVLALAQLNRAVEVRDNKRPRLSDLRESGAIEQDADLVLFLDRPAAYDTAAEPTEARIIVAKHRNGRTGDVALHWDARSMTFRNATKGRPNMAETAAPSTF